MWLIKLTLYKSNSYFIPILAHINPTVAGYPWRNTVLSKYMSEMIMQTNFLPCNFGDLLHAHMLCLHGWLGLAQVWQVVVALWWNSLSSECNQGISENHVHVDKLCTYISRHHKSKRMDRWTTCPGQLCSSASQDSELPNICPFSPMKWWGGLEYTVLVPPPCECVLSSLD